MVPKMLMAVSAIIVVGTIGWWVHDCLDYGKLLVLSKTAREVVTVERDPLFGQDIKQIRLEPGRWLGLFDAVPPFGAIPLSTAGMLIGLIGWQLHKKAKRQYSQKVQRV